MIEDLIEPVIRTVISGTLFVLRVIVAILFYSGDFFVNFWPTGNKRADKILYTLLALLLLAGAVMIGHAYWVSRQPSAALP